MNYIKPSCSYYDHLLAMINFSASLLAAAAPCPV